MTDHDPEEIRRRAYRVLEETAGVEAAMREREKNRFSAPYTRETGSGLHHGAPIETPVRRPASAPRDWIAEAAYFSKCTEQMVEERIEALLAGIGQALARMRTQLRDQMRAEVTAVIGELQRDLQKEFGRSAAPTETEADLARRVGAIGRGIERLEQLVIQLGQAERGDRGNAGVLPN